MAGADLAPCAGTRPWEPLPTRRIVEPAATSEHSPLSPLRHPQLAMVGMQSVPIGTAAGHSCWAYKAGDNLDVTVFFISG